MIAGSVLKRRVRAVGLATLSYACFSYWDTMADWLRLGSIMGALLLLVPLGWWRFGREEPATAREERPVTEPERDAARLRPAA